MKYFYKCLTALFILWSGVGIHAQHRYLDTAWVASSPVVATPYYHTATVVHNGNLIVTGNILNGSHTDVYTYKLNGNGDTLWAKSQSGSLTGGGNDYGIELAITASGDVIVTAAVENNTTGYDYAIYRYSGSNGALQWSYTWDGNSGIDIPSKVIVKDGINAIFVVGGSQASGGGFSDFGIIKIDLSGNFAWEHFYDSGSGLHDAAVSANTMIFNQYLLTVGSSNQSPGTWAIVGRMVKVSDGSTYSTAVSDTSGATMVEATAMAMDSLNNIYITGFGEVGGDKYIETIKLDSNLNEVWVKTLDNPYNDAGNDLAVDASGNVYVTGYTEQDNGEKRAILVKYAANGTEEWTRLYVSQLPVTSEANKIELNSNGDIFITGTVEHDTIGSFFFSQYNADGAVLLSSEYESDTLDFKAFDIAVDGDDIYVTGLANGTGGATTRVLKYTLLEDVNPTYFYLGGQKIYWCQQPGMYAFSTIDSTEITGLVDSTIVISIDYSFDGHHNVFFSPASTNTEIDSIINIIENNIAFDKEYMVPVLTSYNTKPYSEELFIGLDNFVEVVFDDPYMAMVDIEDFADYYNMTLFHAPPSNIHGGVYIFQAERSGNPDQTINLAAEIWETDSLIVKKVNPSLRVVKPFNPYDPLYSGQWWAENDSEGSCNGEPWVIDSDIDLDKAWNLDNEFGYGVSWSGLGITIGVLDFHGYEYDHPDLTGVFEPGYLFPSSMSGGVPMTTTTILDYENAHGQCVSGLIAANLGDSVGIAGVAYNAKIIPGLMIVGTSAAIISGIQKFCDSTLDVSVINMSFGWSTALIPFPDLLAIATACENAYFQGRDSLGMVLITGTGNYTALSTSEGTQVPAIFDEWVLSVGATTPSDHRKVMGDAYDPAGSWGSRTFSGIDVSAPGICMYTTDFQGSYGYDSTDFHRFQGTSAATPLASGVAALILEKNSSLTAGEVYNNLRWGCDKVGGYSYSYGGAPQGTCYELGHGRINAFNSLGWTPFLEIPTEEIGIDFYFNNPANYLLQLTVNGIESYTVTIVNIAGAICYEEAVNQQHYSEINIGGFAKGLYFIKITDNKNNISSTSKLIIQ